MKNKAEVLCACSDLIAEIDRFIEKASDDLAANLKKRGFLKAKFSVKRLSELEDAIAEALEKEAQGVADGAKKATDLDSVDVEYLISSTGAGEDIADALSDHYDKVLPELTDAYIKHSDKGLGFVASTKRTSDWVKSWSEQVAEFMEKTSIDKIQSLLDDHIKSGKGIDYFVNALLDSGIRTERYRARTVAVTETLRAHSIAHHEATLQNPCVVQKMWRHTGAHKNNPRPNHVAMDGKKVAKDKPFTLIGADGGTYYPQFPLDPSLPVGESANCHCITQDIVDDDILGLPLEERQKMQQEALADLDIDYASDIIGIEENRVKRTVIPKMKTDVIVQRQDIHRKGTDLYKRREKALQSKGQYGPSYLSITDDEVIALVDKYKGTGTVKVSKRTLAWTNQETITSNNKIVGVCVNNRTGEEVETSVFKIHYGKQGVHIVPDYPSKKK